MMEQSYLLFSLLLIIGYLVYSYFKHNNNQQKETFQNEGPIDKIEYLNDYVALSNGSLVFIKNILDSVIERNNNGTRLLTFNPGLNPVINCEIIKQEFDDYGQFLVQMMNKQLPYNQFTFVNSEPIYKIRTDNQTKMKFYITTNYTLLTDDLIPFTLLVVLLNEKLYSEFNWFDNSASLDQLPFDIVPEEGKTYIETFDIHTKK